MADAGVLATEDRSEPFVWGDFHRVFMGRGKREDMVQCHRCWLVIADDERATHLRWHAFDDKHRRCETHNRARYYCGCWTPPSL